MAKSFKVFLEFLMENSLYTDFGYIDPTGKVIYGESYDSHNSLTNRLNPDLPTSYLAVMNKWIRWGVPSKSEYITLEFITYDKTVIRNLIAVLNDIKLDSLFKPNYVYMCDIYISKGTDYKFLQFEDKTGLINYLHRYL